MQLILWSLFPSLSLSLSFYSFFFSTLLSFFLSLLPNLPVTTYLFSNDKSFAINAPTPQSSCSPLLLHCPVPLHFSPLSTTVLLLLSLPLPLYSLLSASLKMSSSSSATGGDIITPCGDSSPHPQPWAPVTSCARDHNELLIPNKALIRFHNQITHKDDKDMRGIKGVEFLVVECERVAKAFKEWKKKNEMKNEEMNKRSHQFIFSCFLVIC